MLIFSVFMFRVYVVFCFLVLVVTTSAIDCLERLVSEMKHDIVFIMYFCYCKKMKIHIGLNVIIQLLFKHKV